MSKTNTAEVPAVERKGAVAQLMPYKWMASVHFNAQGATELLAVIDRDKLQECSDNVQDAVEALEKFVETQNSR